MRRLTAFALAFLYHESISFAADPFAPPTPSPAGSDILFVCDPHAAWGYVNEQEIPPCTAAQLAYYNAYISSGPQSGVVAALPPMGLLLRSARRTTEVKEAISYEIALTGGASGEDGWSGIVDGLAPELAQIKDLAKWTPTPGPRPRVRVENKGSGWIRVEGEDLAPGRTTAEIGLEGTAQAFVGRLRGPTGFYYVHVLHVTSLPKPPEIVPAAMNPESSR